LAHGILFGLCGEGRYDTDFLMFDGRGHICRKDLHITARADPREDKVAPLLAPNTFLWEQLTLSSPTPGRMQRLEPPGV
jgi:hypothetical protein